MSRILYISSEAFPLIKTGGLGDVAGSLPVALLKQSQDVRLLLPAYPAVLDKIKSSRLIAQTSYYNLPVDIIETRLPGTRLKVWLADCPAAFRRPGGPYSDEHGQAWHDNALRFTIFCHLAVDLALDNFNLGWQPQVVHCNDWQSALVPALLSLRKKKPASVFTIHNLAYQGIFDRQTFDDLHLPAELWHMHGVEFYGQFSFIKGALSYADKITTVSPSYAKEILHPANGYGLEGLLQHRQKDITGILNGIDHKYWNPGTDEYLKHNYNRRSLNKKKQNKIALQKELSLPVDESIPMIGMISRLVEQKGLDIILQSLAELFKHNIQLVILGTGELHYEIQLTELSQKYPRQLSVSIGYNEALAHRIEGASDMYLMPSTFEPCGLNQLYSLRYGTLPVVTAVGGLADTVIDATDTNIEQHRANGFVLAEHSASALTSSLQRALKLYTKPAIWRDMQVTAMSADYSWDSSARRYIQLYQQILEAGNNKS